MERRIHVGEKDRVVDFAAAVIIPVIELALDRDKGTQTYTAFPAPVTFKHCHCRWEYCPVGEKWIAIPHPANGIGLSSVLRHIKKQKF
jgi:hypothetical protein